MRTKQEKEAFRAGYVMGQTAAVSRLRQKIWDAVEEYLKETLDEADAENHKEK